MPIEFIGANPGAVFYDEEGQPLVSVSIWQASWTPVGHGHAVIIADASGWRSYGSDRDLALYLAENYNQYFLDTPTFAWTGSVGHTEESLAVDIVPGSHLSLTSNSLTITMSDVIAMKPVEVEKFRLGERTLKLQTVIIPCRTATLREGDGPTHSRIRVQGDDSSAFIAVGEVWTSAESSD